MIFSCTTLNLKQNLFRLNAATVICFLFVCVFATFETAAEWRTQADDNWKMIDLQDLSIKPGTALDFSFLVEKGEAGQYGFLKINDKGQFIFEKRPDVPVRFFCAAEIPLSRIPTPFGDWDNLAEQIRLAGYNAVRAHFLDQELMWNSKQEGVFNPEMVDRWERYTTALKKRGIYLVMDASSSWAAFSIYKSWEKQSFPVMMKSRLYYDNTAREIWMNGVKQIFEHVNPYTGRALKDDPQVIWVSLRNEPGLNFLMTSKCADPGMVKPFREWLRKRYSSRAALASAWGSSLGANITFETVELPSPKEKGPAGADLQRFFTDIEQETYLWGAAFMRNIGVKVPVIDYNNGASMQSIIARDVMPFVDNHVYHDHPSTFISPGAKMTCDNSLKRQIGDFRWIIPTRLLGRPFTFTEWGGVFWNPYRHHDGMTFAAYAAFQDWQLLAQHATPVWPSLAIDKEKWGYIVPFMIAKDPPAKANERMTAFLFARGDVSPSPHLVELRFDASNIFSKMNTGDSVSHLLTPLALLSGFGSRVEGGQHSAPRAPYTPDLVIIPDRGTEIKTVDGAELTEAKGADSSTEMLIKIMRRKKVLDNLNRTDLSKNIFESDTLELYLESEKRRFALKTPRSQGVCLPDGPCSSSVGEIEVENHGACMTLMLSSLSSEPIASSKRLLLILSGDALNSNMVFEDESRKTLINIGQAPVIVRLLDISLRARLSEPDKWEVWALAQNGTRVEKIPLEVNNGRVSVKLKTGKLKNGPTPYFEFVNNINQ